MQTDWGDADNQVGLKGVSPGASMRDFALKICVCSESTAGRKGSNHSCAKKKKKRHMVKHLEEFGGTLHRDLSEPLMNNAVVGVQAGAAGSLRNNLVLQQCGGKKNK